MKTLRFAAAALLTLAAFGCSQGAETDTGETEQPLVENAAPAPEPGDAVAKRHRKHRDPAKLIEKLDANKDGVLELSEIPEEKRQWLSGADADKDGKLSLTELENARPKHHGKFRKSPEKMIEHFDANKNGVLELTELPEHKRERLSAADTDKDGKLSVTELESARPMMKGHRGFWKKDPAKLIERFDADKNGSLEVSELPEHKREKLGAADANKDGKLAVEELKAHFEARMKEHRSRFEKQAAPGETSL